MADNCVHCLTELTVTPDVCTRCRKVRPWCDTCRSSCSIKEHKKRVLVDDKGTECQQYCPKCKEHPNMIFRGFKNVESDSWCVGLSINSNKPQELAFMPFTKYHTLITSQQYDDRKVKGGSWEQMKNLYYDKWLAWDKGNYCGGW